MNVFAKYEIVSLVWTPVIARNVTVKGATNT